MVALGEVPGLADVSSWWQSPEGPMIVPDMGGLHRQSHPRRGLYLGCVSLTMVWGLGPVPV